MTNVASGDREVAGHGHGAGGFRPPAPILPSTPIPAESSRLTVDEYHRLIRVGILNEDDRCELLEGRIVPYEKRSPPHEYSRHVLARAFDALVSEDDWIVRHRSGVTLADSEPEPGLYSFGAELGRTSTGIRGRRTSV